MIIEIEDMYVSYLDKAEYHYKKKLKEITLEQIVNEAHRI